MSRLGRLLRALGLASVLTPLVGCQAIFGDYKVDDGAFAGAGNVGQGGSGGGSPAQTGPIVLAPTTGLYTTEWGGQATFTIVLDHAPTADVTVALSSSNISEGTVSPASVTFNKDDWKAPQVVTVTGIDDRIPDFNKAYKIITAPATSDDPSFNGVDPVDIDLINIDNETAGITVVPRSGLVTSEAGAQDTFTVVLNSQPTKDVTINLVSDTPAEGTVAPQSLIFTAVNWMAPQLVTVTGVDDDAKDPDHPYKITVSSTSEDQDYAHVAPVSVDVINQDNESAGVTVALVSGIDPIDPTKLRTSESGDSATFTVVLNAQPSADVTIAVSSDTPSEGTVSPQTLTFTQFNWNAPQTVTVTGVEDDDTADGDQPFLIVLGTPTGDDTDYAALPETDIPAANVDNDKAGFSVMLVTGIDPQDPSKLLTSEAGTTATFTLALNSKPSKPVTIPLYSSLPSEGSVIPMSLTFTPVNWQSPQTVSVTGVDDDIQDGSPLFFVRTGVATSMDPRYDGLDAPDVQVTNQDDDSANVRVVLAKGIDPLNATRLATDEFGSTATFTVALTSEPTADVSIPLVSSNPKEGTVSPATLTFTTLNYRAPQTVTITGVNDDVVVDGNQPFSINVGAATSDDPNFNGKFASQVQVTNRDDDLAGVIVTPTSGLVTSESGKTDSFTIRLQSKPSADVSIAISSSNPAEGKPNVSSVVFTSTNWNANQTVVVTGQDDDGAQDGSPTYKIILDPTQSKDPNYNGKIDPPDVTLTNTDNDTAGFVVSPTSGLVTGESGLKATFTIKLTSKPVGTGVNVKIQLTSSDLTEGTVSPGTVTFDAVNWNSLQTVTVTGVNDDVADGSQPYMILTSQASSIDGNYNGKKPPDVSVINVDDDSAGVNILPIPSATPTATTEKSAGKATFTVALTSLPTADVTYTVTSLDTSEGTVSPGTLKFTTTNGKTPQTVTVTGVNDDLADGDQQYTVRLSNGTSTDPGYNGKFGTDLPFINLDDDHPGLEINPTTGLKTSEKNAGAATFTVALMSQPTAGVSIAVSSSNTGEGKVSPATLAFTTGNWATPQPVTITGVQDDVADGTQNYQVLLANATSTDSNYGGKFGTQLDVQNLDDDQAGYTVNADPILQTTEKGGKATFSVVLTSKPAGTSTVTLGLTSSNTKEGTVSPSSLVFTGANWDDPTAHVVTVTGVDDKKADKDVGYQITFTADATYSVPAPLPVALTNLDDDVLGVLVTPTTCATTPGTTATFTISLNSQPSANVTISLTSDTPMEGTVSPDSVTFTPSGSGSWDTLQTVTVTGVNDGTMGTMTPYKIITGNASAPGETTGYDGYTSVADVSCTNTTPPPVTPTP
ncbi:MAG: Calx-beta domain-containing protein [Pseudomonadota bacterium]